MKGDFSRQTFDPKKHYKAVLMQQGRVQVDADWNEQQAITQYRIETEAKDVIGLCGAPKQAPGFEIGVGEKRGDQKETNKNIPVLLIGKGRYYVDGILCENDDDISYDAQPDLPNPPDVVDLLKNAETTVGLVYLDVWQRHITVLDEPLLREVALGGADTTTRIKTVWQVKVLPIKIPSWELKRVRIFLRQVNVKLKEISQSSQGNEIILVSDIAQNFENFHDNLEKKPRSNFQELNTFLIEKQQQLQKIAAGLSRDSQNQAKLERIVQDIASFSPVTCGSQLVEWDELTAPNTNKGTLKARTQPFIDPQNRCIIPPQAGYQRLENQLYRVEIHKGGSLNDATFKWSRDNGSVVTKITAINSHTVTVSDVGRDEILGFATEQWVEVLDDWTELKGEPGHLTQIDNVDAATGTITLKSTIPSSLIPSSLSPEKVQERHFKLRRWDSKDALPIKPDLGKDWISLEGGIEVKFSDGSYKTGDYWLIPARTATGEIEWPPYEIPNVNPTSQPPLGIQHHYCRLAIVQLKDRTLSVQDCRRIFSPLTEVPTAIHVIGTNWNNDDVFDWEQFKNGLHITLDTMPVQQEPGLKTVSRATMIVTAEVPLQGTNKDLQDPKGERAINVSFILDGAITVQSNTIQWIPVPEEIDQLKALLGNRSQMLIRLTLKGHAIWSDIGNQRLYLDGQAFGAPGVRADGTQRTALIFPSGDGARASDFESWFYLGGFAEVILGPS